MHKKDFIAKALTKAQQKKILGGSLSHSEACKDYNGPPTTSDCDFFYSLPVRHQRCLFLDADCVPRP